MTDHSRTLKEERSCNETLDIPIAVMISIHKTKDAEEYEEEGESDREMLAHRQ